MTLVVSLDRRSCLLGGLALATMLGACSTDRAPKTSSIKFLIEADSLVNPNEKGEASPVVVRVYELKSVTAFMQASFFELLDNDTQKLGADLVAKREFELKPGAREEFERDTPIETTEIGVVAWFRNLDQADWRKTFKIEPERNNSIVVKVTAQSISIDTDSSRRWRLF